MSAVETKLFRDELLREGEELAVFASARRESTPSRALLGELAEKMRQSREVDGPVRQAIEHAEELGIRREFRREVLRAGKQGAKRLAGVVLLELDEKERGEKQKEKKGRSKISAFFRSIRTDRDAMAMKGNYWASLERAAGIADTNHIEYGAAIMAEIERRRRNGTYDQFKATSVSEAIEVYMGNPGSRLPNLTAIVLTENIYGEESGMSNVIKKIKKAAGASLKEFGKKGIRMSQTGRDFEFILEHIIACAKIKKDTARSGRFIVDTVIGALDYMKDNPRNFSPDRLGLRDNEIIDLTDGAAGSQHGAGPMLERLGDDDDARGVLLLIREGAFRHKEIEKERRSGKESPYA